eukprot:TRINITY_DN12704_c0_g1_i1.p1 TRINITY_DN12704_c0_g1~~TRINITY_DN12704_c0_g1_i1.p1  ORF type:complete len:383 (-),score=29.70 TRINITY_DN12704_c0_g1_i1:87-1235(-)
MSNTLELPNPASRPQQRSGKQARQKKRRPHHPYGSVDKSYGFRVQGADKAQDVRLKFLRREWFYQKSCLEIGCNSGQLSITLAVRFDCQSMLGMDVSQDLVKKACQNVRWRSVRLRKKMKQRGSKGGIGMPYYPISMALCHGPPRPLPDTEVTLSDLQTSEDLRKLVFSSPTPVPPPTTTNSTTASPNTASTNLPEPLPPPPPATPTTQQSKVFPKNIHFTCADFLTSEWENASDSKPPSPSPPPPSGSSPRPDTIEAHSSDQGSSSPTPQFDTIVCFNVTKWIHLNHGDQGIRDLFQKIYRMLSPGGLLLLEAQPWPSYKRKSNHTPEIHKQFQSIAMKPKDFPLYLTRQIGFESIQLLGVPSIQKNEEYRRPIYLCRKRR